ncbi:MAG: hypothetical protein AB1671_07135 [Thermodesulfobacteriota bacterium]
MAVFLADKKIKNPNLAWHHTSQIGPYFRASASKPRKDLRNPGKKSETVPPTVSDKQAR